MNGGHGAPCRSWADDPAECAGVLLSFTAVVRLDQKEGPELIAP